MATNQRDIDEWQSALFGPARTERVLQITGVFVGEVMIEVLLSTGVLIGIARAKSTRVRTGLARKD